VADRERLAFSVPQFQPVSGVGVPALEHPSSTSVLPAQALANSTPILNDSARVVFGLADMLVQKRAVEERGWRRSMKYEDRRPLCLLLCSSEEREIDITARSPLEKSARMPIVPGTSV
jgi:hypothetical protein